MRPSVTYTPCAIYSREKTGNITTFAQFEEEVILTKTCNNAEIVDGSDYNSIMPPLLIKEEMDAMDSGNGSDDDIMCAEML